MFYENSLCVEVEALFFGFPPVPCSFEEGFGYAELDNCSATALSSHNRQYNIAVYHLSSSLGRNAAGLIWSGGVEASGRKEIGLLPLE